MASINDTLIADVKKIITDEKWEVVDGQTVPTVDDIKLGNHGKRISATILYADLAESTSLVNNHTDTLAAEVYKSYLICAVKIIRNNGGIIISFDGDRVMGIFYGGYKNSSAAKAALQINYAVTKIINPRLKSEYPNKNVQIKAACGVDTSKVLVVRGGIRGTADRNNNDLIWIGRAANYAAKLCGLREDGYSSWITKDVYDKLSDEAKTSSDGRAMWEARTWTKYNLTVYRSNWTWPP